MYAGSANQAFVCCCICRFPLPQLTASELQHHPTNTDLFQHFHLPLAAAQLIKTKDQKVQWEMHLFKLHKAHILLLEQEAELAAFEEQVDASRLSLQKHTDAEIANVKAKIRALRQAFTAALKAAIKETSDRALEQWTPASGSLSALICNFDLSNPANLKVFTLQQEVAGSSNSLRIGIKSALPAFSRFEQSLSTREETGNQKVLEEARQQCRLLQADVDKLRQEVTDARGENARLKEQVASLQRSQQATPAAAAPSKTQPANAGSVQSSQLPKSTVSTSSQTWPANAASVQSTQLPKPVVTPPSQAKPPQTVSAQPSRPAASPLSQGKTEQAVTQSASSVPRQSSQPPKPAAAPHSQGKTDHFHIGLAYKEQGKYAESNTELSAAWDAAKRVVPATEESVKIAIALAEVVGLHMGKVGDAENCLELVRANLRASQQSTEVAELANVSAALSYSCGQFLRCAEICTRTLQSYPAAKAKGSVFWTAVYYCVLANCELPNSTAAETELSKCAAVGYADDVSRVLGMTARGRFAFAKNDFAEAESQLQNAVQRATQRFPTSVFYAYAKLWLGRTYMLRKNGNNDIQALQDAIKCFAAHYPTNIWRPQALMWEAKAQKAIGMTEDAVAKANQAERLYKVHYPDAENRIAVLLFIASGYRDLGFRDFAIARRLEVQDLYAKQRAQSLAVQQNLVDLAILYQESRELEAAVKWRLSVHRALQASHPTNLLLPLNLIALASIYQLMGDRASAIEKRVEANKALQAHNSTDANFLQNLIDLADLYQEDWQLSLALAVRLTLCQHFSTRRMPQGTIVLNIERLAELCLNLGKLQEAENYALQAKATVTAPSSSAAQNLYTLSLTYERMGRIAEAIDIAQEVQRMWQSLNSPNVQSLAVPLMQRLQSIKKRGRPIEP